MDDGTIEIYWDKKVITPVSLEHNTPDLIVIEKGKRVSMTCMTGHQGWHIFPISFILDPTRFPFFLGYAMVFSFTKDSCVEHTTGGKGLKMEARNSLKINI